MAGATVSAGLAKALMTAAVRRGASEKALALRSGVNPADLEDQDNRIAFDRYVALVREAKARTGDGALPIHFAEEIDMSEFSVVGLIADASETMMDALAQLNRYGQLVIEVDGIAEGGRFAISPEKDGVWLIDRRANPNDFWELTESTFTRMIVGPRRRLGERPFMLEAQVTHAEPAHAAAYERVWGVPVQFGAARNALKINNELSFTRLQLMPRYVFGVLSDRADKLLADLESARTTRGRVEALLMPVLHTGEASMDLIASRMGLSRQTLFRKLKAEGVTFEKVLDELRHKLAVSYLAARKVSVNETAYLVGFSEPAAFSRAFKRWTGTSPREMRAKAA